MAEHWACMSCINTFGIKGEILMIFNNVDCAYCGQSKPTTSLIKTENKLSVDADGTVWDDSDDDEE